MHTSSTARLDIGKLSKRVKARQRAVRIVKVMRNLVKVLCGFARVVRKGRRATAKQPLQREISLERLDEEGV